MSEIMDQPANQIDVGQAKGRIEQLGNKVVIRRDPRPTTVGKILLPDNGRPATYLGTVESVGPGVEVEVKCTRCHELTTRFQKPVLKPGDRVIIPELGGQEIKDWDDGEPIVIIEDDFLHGKVVS